MKFELQVYKMKDDRFMIDFQRIEGGVVTSLDVVSLLMKRLQLR
jgi:5'-AMP-activated protein kinase catalytic alpha subunit